MGVSAAEACKGPSRPPVVTQEQGSASAVAMRKTNPKKKKTARDSGVHNTIPPVDPESRLGRLAASGVDIDAPDFPPGGYDDETWRGIMQDLRRMEYKRPPEKQIMTPEPMVNGWSYGKQMEHYHDILNHDPDRPYPCDVGANTLAILRTFQEFGRCNAMYTKGCKNWSSDLRRAAHDDPDCDIAQSLAKEAETATLHRMKCCDHTICEPCFWQFQWNWGYGKKPCRMPGCGVMLSAPPGEPTYRTMTGLIHVDGKYPHHDTDTCLNHQVDVEGVTVTTSERWSCKHRSCQPCWERLCGKEENTSCPICTVPPDPALFYPYEIADEEWSRPWDRWKIPRPPISYRARRHGRTHKKKDESDSLQD